SASPPRDSSRRGARGPCGSGSTPGACGHTRPAAGWATTRPTASGRSWSGWRRTNHGRWTSAAAGTGRAARGSAGPAARRGTRPRSARGWLGDEAVHRVAPVLERLAAYEPRSVDIDGCVYREGLQAVRMSAGVAGNTVPDEAWLDVNFRCAPDRDTTEALD